MKAKKSVAFTISICTVYVLTVLFYVISLAVEYKNGAEKSRNRFNSITKDVSRISRTYPPRSEKFYDEVLDSLGNISDIAGIQLAYGNELIFSYPKDLKELNSIRSYLVNPLTTTVFTDKGIPVSITASIYILKPSSIYYKGRIAFVIILLATLVTAIHLILYIKNGTFPKESENDDLEEDEIDYPDISTYDIEPEKDNDSAVDSDEEKNAQNQESDNSEPQKKTAAKSGSDSMTETEKNIPSEAKEDDVLAFLEKEKEASENKEENPENKNTDEPLNNDASEPKGLFCPETGFGWEEYMLTRLDSELLRSASSDQDLSLFTMRIEGIDWTSEYGKTISKLIIEKIKFNDLVFNYGNDGASIIFQNQNTDQALITAETLYNDIEKVLKEINSGLHCSIGISTRSLRLISAARLSNESEEALKRALEDKDSPIIAFRVNPERYKDFLASESFQEKDRPVEKSEDEKLLESLPEPPAEDDFEDENPEDADVISDEDFPEDFDIEEELKLGDL